MDHIVVVVDGLEAALLMFTKPGGVFEVANTV